MFRKGLLGLSLLLLLLAATTFSLVQAQTGFPPLPHAFYGRVYINGEEAPAGTRIEGRGEAVETGIQGNPIDTVAKGFYGSTDNSVINLVVQGWVTEGTPIEFYVNGQKAYCNDGSGWEESYPYQAGGITALDLWLGALSTQAVVPTATKTPTFAPTVPRTATPTAQPQSATVTTVPRTATPTAQPQSATRTAEARVTTVSTAQQTPDDMLPTTTLPLLTPTGRTMEESPVSGVVDSGTAESGPNGQPPAAESTSAVQQDANGIRPGVLIGIMISIPVVLFAVLWFLRRRAKRLSQDEGELFEDNSAQG